MVLVGEVVDTVAKWMGVLGGGGAVGMFVLLMRWYGKHEKEHGEMTHRILELESGFERDKARYNDSVDKNTAEHMIISQEIASIKELLARIATDLEWIKKKNGGSE